MLQRLEHVRYPQIHCVIKIPESGPVEIENRLSLNAEYDLNSQKCIAKLEVNSQCKSNVEWFNVSLEVVGVFACDKVESDDDMKQAHTEAYDMLFPYAQSTIAELTTKGGGSPFMLEKTTIDFSGVKLDKG